MTPQDRLKELTKGGAVIQGYLPEGEPFALTLAGANWEEKPKMLVWSAIFPEHQGNVHTTKFDKVELENQGRDLAFYKDDKRVLSVVPYQEGPLPVDEVRERLAEWVDQITNDEYAEEWREFMGIQA